MPAPGSALSIDGQLTVHGERGETIEFDLELAPRSAIVERGSGVVDADGDVSRTALGGPFGVEHDAVTCQLVHLGTHLRHLESRAK